jgi:hypothetical protein
MSIELINDQVKTIRFYQGSEEALSNGDIRYFGFLIHGHLKTFCYLAKSQIVELEKDFTLLVSPLDQNTEKTNLWTQSLVLKEKRYINIGFMYIMASEGKENEYWKKDSLRIIKILNKSPILSLLLSDQPEIFHKVKPAGYSYKNMNLFKYSDFVFSAKDIQSGDLEKRSVSYQIRNMKTATELTQFVFGDQFPDRAKKIVMRRILHKDNGDIKINYEMVRTVHFLKHLFTTEEICLILENHYSKLMKNDLFDLILWKRIDKISEKSEGLIKFISAFPTFKDKLNQLMKFNIPNHILEQFTQTMGAPYEMFKPDLLKISDALYFHNALSLDYGRATLPNFKLTASFEKENKDVVDALDGLKVEEWTYVIPKDYKTLLQWGSTLSNCVANYQEKGYPNKLLIGILKGNKIVYLLDLKGGSHYRKVAQFRGFKNAIPSKEVLTQLMAPILLFLGDPKECMRCLIKGEDDSLI